MSERIKLRETTYQEDGEVIRLVTYLEDGKEVNEHHYPKRPGSNCTVIFNDKYCVSREEAQKRIRDVTISINKSIYEMNKEIYMNELKRMEEETKLPQN